MTPETFCEQFATFAEAPNGVARLRELILQLAVQGKLVPQDENDEPAAVLFSQIQAERSRLIAEGVMRRSKPLPPVCADEQPFQIPTQWSWIRFDDVGDWGAGATPNRGRLDYFGGNIKWFKSGELNDACIDDSEEKITKLALKECSLRENEPGDVLVAMYGATIGKVAILNVPATTNQAVCACTCHSGIFNRYLFLMLKAFKPYFISNSSGAAQPNFSKEKIVRTPFPLPPLAEQLRIVGKVDQLLGLCDELAGRQAARREARSALVGATLDRLVSARSAAEFPAHAHRLRDHFDRLFDTPTTIPKLRQAILQLAVQGQLVPQDPNDEPASVLTHRVDSFFARLVEEKRIRQPEPLAAIPSDYAPFALPKNWVWRRLGTIIRIASGDGLTSHNMTKAGEIPVYGGNGVTGYHDAHNVTEPTLVIGRVGFYCGSIHLTPDRAWVTDNAFITTFPKDAIDIDFLYWLLKATNLRENDNATAQPVISGKKVYPTIVALPPQSEQKRIVSKVTELLSLCDALEAKLTQAESASTHLLSAAVAHLLQENPRAGEEPRGETAG